MDYLYHDMLFYFVNRSYPSRKYFFIGDDKKSIIAINQIIAETEITALENTEIEVIQAEAMAAKKYQQAAE